MEFWLTTGYSRGEVNKWWRGKMRKKAILVKLFIFFFALFNLHGCSYNSQLESFSDILNHNTVEIKSIKSTVDDYEKSFENNEIFQKQSLEFQRKTSEMLQQLNDSYVGAPRDSKESILEIIAMIAPSVVWLIIILVILFCFLKTKLPERIAQLFRNFRSIKWWGAEFILNEEVRRDAVKAMDEYRAQVKAEFDRGVIKYEIAQKFESVAEDIIKFLDAERERKIADTNPRFTIHIPDILFQDTLYQLLDYYPSGGGSGRTWSTGFGIIGRAWRSDKTLVKEKVPTDTDTLIMNWGMRRRDATASGKNKSSFAAVLLKDKDQNNIGILYIDAKEENAFHNNSASTPLDEKKFKNNIIEICNKRGLISSLSLMRNELLDKAPMIKANG